MAERIIAEMRQPISLEEAEVQVRSTVGGVWAVAKLDLERLVSQADAVLYSAKAEGKDKWAVEASR